MVYTSFSPASLCLEAAVHADIEDESRIVVVDNFETSGTLYNKTGQQFASRMGPD